MAGKLLKDTKDSENKKLNKKTDIKDDKPDIYILGGGRVYKEFEKYASEILINNDNRHSKNKRKLKKIICFITVFLLLCYCITGIIYLLNKETLSCLAFLFPFFN